MWPRRVGNALLLGTWVLLTGGLHLDGLLDSCDGLFGGRTVEDRLRILRDPRAGSFAVVGGVLVLLTKFEALTALQERWTALLLAPVLGRWAVSLVLILFPYVRAEGVGRTMKDHARAGDLVLATTIAVAVVAAVPEPFAAEALGAAFVVALGVAALAWWRIGGLTGDVYGAVCELSETGVLLLLCSRKP